MNHADPLAARYPHTTGKLATVPLCTLPTPVEEHRLAHAGGIESIWIKRDDLSGAAYGGNKVRKLEYLFGRLLKQRRSRVATFGAIGSNHCLATALYARRVGLAPICFLSHQSRTSLVAQTLRAHIDNGSELVPFSGTYAKRVRTLRTHLWHRRAGVIPMGGSSWLGTVGFVNAGLELAAQIDGGSAPSIDSIYIATGTMGSAAGLALGLALAGLACEVQAVRVSHETIANDPACRRLLDKTVYMLRDQGADLPANLARRARLRWRHDYFAPGYARSNEKTERAIDVAAERLGLSLEATYTGKALAALLDDFPSAVRQGSKLLFWNTYHSRPLPPASYSPTDTAALPEAFQSYLRGDGAR